MSTARSAMQEVSPKLAEIAADVLFGDVWERPELSKRDRSMITVANLIALYRTCLLYTSPSPRDLSTSRMPSSA